MKKFKKISIAAIALVLLLSLCTLASCSAIGKGIDEKKEQKAHEAFIDELGGVSDTYVGAVSDNEFDSVEDAAVAFINEQIVGKGGYATSVKVGKSQTASISDIDLSAEDKAGVTGVELVEVSYTNKNSLLSAGNSGVMALGTLNENKTVKVYIIKYGTDLKYYSPCPVTGDTITKSYHDSVFDYTKYQNCTYTTVSEMTETITLFGFLKVNVDITTTQTIKYTEDAILFEQKLETSPAIFGETTMLYAYMTIDEDYDIDECYVSKDGETWNRGILDIIGYDNNALEITPFYDQYLDYTYFTKTDYGFQLSEENSDQYVKETLDDIDTSGLDDLGIEMFAKYYVCDGVLTGMRSEIYMDASMYVAELEQNIDMKVAGVTEVKITDCGTTEIEKPF